MSRVTMLNMTTQQMLAPFRRAITQWNMIEEGDKIAVGISGGKDSFTLLSLMHAYQRFCPQKFELAAITIDLGFSTENVFGDVQRWCDERQINYHITKTDIGEILFDLRKESNPCSLCSKMRRGALNTKLKEIGFNKLALGHSADDVIETLLLSLMYEGRLSSFAPISYMDRSEISMIRPMVLIWERDIIAYAKDLPIVHNPCPANKMTKRQYMKDLITSLQKDIPFVKERMLGALTHPERYNLWDGVLQKYNEGKQTDNLED